MPSAVRPSVRGVVRALLEDREAFGFARWLLLQRTPLALDLRGDLWTGRVSLEDLRDAGALRRYLTAAGRIGQVEALDDAERRYWNGEAT